MSVFVLVMGVSGSGKSTVAKALADKAKLAYFDADDFHSEKAKADMSAGIPLNDAQREPWIQRLIALVESQMANETPSVLAFSGLKVKHRRRLMQASEKTKGIMLSIDKDRVNERLQQRSNHFFHPTLVDNQFQNMQPIEADEAIMSVTADAPLITIVTRIEEYLND